MQARRTYSMESDLNPAIDHRKQKACSNVAFFALRPLSRLGVGLAIGLTGITAYAADAQESYLEALGASIAVSQVGDVSKGENPLHDDASASNRLTHDGNVRHASNVPTPGKPGAGTPQQAAQQATQQQTTQRVPQHPSMNNTAQFEPLPDPRLHPQHLVDIPQEVLNRLAPADTEQLRKIIEQLYQRQGAALTPARPAITSKASQYHVDLSPGAQPPVIRVANGVGATVNFVDAGGNPWPIAFANNFHAEAFTITQMAPHVLSVAANSPHLSGSVGVMLQGLTTPVNFVVTPAQDATDYRADLLVPGMSPDAPPLVGAQQSRPGIASGGLTDYMYGATPEGAVRLKVTGAGSQDTTTRAWQDKNGNLVLRTAARVVSPGWYDMLPALDGTSVYQLPASPVVRVSVNGKLQTFNLDGLTPKKTDLAKK